MNLGILKDDTLLDTKAMLFIEPLAPLSLVSSMPGAYYLSQREPSNFMIYGLLENLLGWHFTENERTPIINDLKKYHKKNYKMTLNFDQSSVGYRPLLQNHLKIEKLLLKPHIESYEDYWTQHAKHNDKRHLNGSRHYDSSLEELVNALNLTRSKESKEKDKIKKNNLKIEIDYLEYEILNRGLLPNYYLSPKKREFIIVTGAYGYEIYTNKALLDLIHLGQDVSEEPLYLGNSEGWVIVRVVL